MKKPEYRHHFLSLFFFLTDTSLEHRGYGRRIIFLKLQANLEEYISVQRGFANSNESFPPRLLDPDSDLSGEKKFRPVIRNSVRQAGVTRPNVDVDTQLKSITEGGEGTFVIGPNFDSISAPFLKRSSQLQQSINLYLVGKVKRPYFSIQSCSPLFLYRTLLIEPYTDQSPVFQDRQQHRCILFISSRV